MINGFLWILNDLGSAGRGKKRDKEEGVTRRKEGQGGRRDKEEGETRRLKQGRIHGPKSLLEGRNAKA